MTNFSIVSFPQFTGELRSEWRVSPCCGVVHFIVTHLDIENNGGKEFTCPVCWKKFDTPILEKQFKMENITIPKELLLKALSQLKAAQEDEYVEYTQTVIADIEAVLAKAETKNLPKEEDKK